MSWLVKLLKQKTPRPKQSSNFPQNSRGAPGENVGAPLQPGQAAVFRPPPGEKEDRNVRKKNRKAQKRTN